MPDPKQIDIRPLTFVETYHSTGTLINALMERDVIYQRWLGSRPWLKLILRSLVMPPYLHLGNSGYGAFTGEQLVGWLYLCGYRRTLYISLVVVHPDWRGSGVGRSLVAFAEEQASALQRSWLALRVATQNAPATALYEAMGFYRAHWRVLSRQCGATLPIRAEGIRLHPLFGLTSWQAYWRISAADLEAGDAWGKDILPRFLGSEPTQWIGRCWLVTTGSKTEAFASLRGSRTSPQLYLAAPQTWWGTNEELAATKAILDTLGETPPSIELRLGSTGHHEATREMLASVGFIEQPAPTMRMFKPLRGEGKSV